MKKGPEATMIVLSVADGEKVPENSGAEGLAPDAIFA